MLITAEYRLLNAGMFSIKPDFGSKGYKDNDKVLKYRKQHGIRTVLDYGCGRGSLKVYISGNDPEITVYQYDPALNIDERVPCDLVVCRYVLEHVEPECVDDVLSDIRRLSLRFALLSIACQLSKDILPDGSNTHRSIHPPSWWTQKLSPLYKKLNWHKDRKGLIVEATC